MWIRIIAVSWTASFFVVAFKMPRAYYRGTASQLIKRAINRESGRVVRNSVKIPDFPQEALKYGLGVSPETAASFAAGVGVFSHQDWVEAWQTCGNVDYEVDEVEGEIPLELAGGELFRAGPGRFERGGRRYEHVLDGDGYALKLAFFDKEEEEGKGSPPDDAAAAGASAIGGGAGESCPRRVGCRVKGRFVRTRCFEEEEASGEIRFRNTFGSQPSSPTPLSASDATGVLGGLRKITAAVDSMSKNAFNLELKNVANTNAQYWGGRLLMCWEAGMPHELDPNTLLTQGPTDLDGFTQLGNGGRSPPVDTGSQQANALLGFGGTAFTAHPHVDPIKKRLVGWGWTNVAKTNSMRIKVAEWDENWQLACASTSFLMRGCTLAPHDFALSASYAVFVENRMAMDMAPYLLGLKGPAQVLTMQPELPVRLHVKRRAAHSSGAGLTEEEEGEADFVLDCPSWFCIHLSHATQSADGRTLQLFGSGWPKQQRGPNGEAPEFLGAWGGEAPVYDRIPVTHFWRTTVELWPPTSPTSPSAETTTPPSSTSSSSSADSPSYPRVTSHAPWPNAELCVEHPKVHPQHECGLTGLGGGGVESGGSASHYRPAPRFAYMSCSNKIGLATAPQGWARVDLADSVANHQGDLFDGSGGEEEDSHQAKVLTTWLGSRTFAEELVLVPMALSIASSKPLSTTEATATTTGTSTGEEEEEGGEEEPSARCWLLGLFYDAESKRSGVAIVDGRTMGPPVAKLWLKHVSPHGLHGSWRPPPKSVERRSHG
mmetsp:Transcript_88776/g.177513  ORF Transcript_88776/g.177513 Transcript_88776/m.177513 type:complete len:772 (+) Transcript_88776:103-2418(+)